MYEVITPYDVEKLVNIVCEYLEAEADAKAFNLKIRKDRGLSPDSTIWGPSLNGSDGYRLGELSERAQRSGWILSDICQMLDINQDRLISAVKSMRRWERRSWRWNASAYIIDGITQKDKERLMQYLKNGDIWWKTCFKSTGRKMPWCE